MRNQEELKKHFLYGQLEQQRIEDDRRGSRPSGKAVQAVANRLAVISRSAQGSQKVRSI